MEFRRWAINLIKIIESIHLDIYSASPSRAATTRSKIPTRTILEKPPKASVIRKNFDWQSRFAFPL